MPSVLTRDHNQGRGLETGRLNEEHNKKYLLASQLRRDGERAANTCNDSNSLPLPEAKSEVAGQILKVVSMPD